MSPLIRIKKATAELLGPENLEFDQQAFHAHDSQSSKAFGAFCAVLYN